MHSITKYDDIIDVSDLIKAVEAGENEVEQPVDADYHALVALLDECREAGGGDKQWRGDWYPSLLIRESYFTHYAQELADDIGAIPEGMQWPLTCIDWDQAARELRMDYTSVDFSGVTYWTR
jgi:hypothetical protein